MLEVTLGGRGQRPQGLQLGLGPEDPRLALRLQAQGGRRGHAWGGGPSTLGEGLSQGGSPGWEPHVSHSPGLSPHLRPSGL